MSFFFGGSKKSLGPAKVEFAPPTPPTVTLTRYVVVINIEKELQIGSKEIVTVPILIPEAPDLELRWDISVVRGDVGVSANFATNDELSEDYSSPDSVSEVPSDPSPDEQEEATLEAATPRRRFSWLRGRGRQMPQQQQQQQVENVDEAPPSPVNAAGTTVLEYERISRIGLEGSYRFAGRPAAGRVEFTFDNRHSRARKKVVIKIEVSHRTSTRSQMVLCSSSHTPIVLPQCHERTSCQWERMGERSLFHNF